ncbi:hypothetical protein K491DRAFT_673424 [Lophiostoma macrostomum CBS 122681]|uniref:Uncharacterized protein n=1 Tax=Lophiostoma macrostomum CBS 122681 TaxID=1314788 RepID=A0A6A6TR21_9PLEO|nr:hypothetical protein K491DRAFT_673424 [Lophiostoma macrostomum CBS 122681]
MFVACQWFCCQWTYISRQPHYRGRAYFQLEYYQLSAHALHYMVGREYFYLRLSGSFRLIPEADVDVTIKKTWSAFANEQPSSEESPPPSEPTTPDPDSGGDDFPPESPPEKDETKSRSMCGRYHANADYYPTSAYNSFTPTHHDRRPHSSLSARRMHHRRSLMSSQSQATRSRKKDKTRRAHHTLQNACKTNSPGSNTRNIDAQAPYTTAAVGTTYPNAGGT